MRIRDLIATMVLFLAASPMAQACSACFGKSDSNMAKGLNYGIFAMLLVITSMLSLISVFFVFVARRSPPMPTPPDPEPEALATTSAKV